jgi:hypothetical protein
LLNGLAVAQHTIDEHYDGRNEVKQSKAVLDLLSRIAN